MQRHRSIHHIRSVSKKSRIDYFVISHYHVDHMGTIRKEKGKGVFVLLQEGIRIGTIFDRGDVTTTAALRVLQRNDAARRLVEWRITR